MRNVVRLEVRDSLGSLAAAWDELVAAMPLPTPFLRTWWLDSVVAHKPTYLLAFDGPTLLGGLALDRRRIAGVDRYRFLGAGQLCPDHLDLVARADAREEVAAAVRSWLQSPGSRVLDLDGMYEDALLRQVAEDAIVAETDVSPYQALSPDTPYLDTRSGKFKRHRRAAQRKADAAGVTIEQVSRGGVPAAIEAFEALHAPRADRARLLARMPELRRAWLSAAAREELLLYRADCKGVTVGVLVCYDVAGRVSVYQCARRMDEEFAGVGTLLDQRAYDDAGQWGRREVDMLRGDERYKRECCDEQRALLRLRTSAGVGGAALLSALRLGELLRQNAGRARSHLRRILSRT
jgi:hypothetical protein